MFIEDAELRDSVTQLLKRSYDAQRLVQKFSLGRGDPDDLICLSRAIESSKEIQRVLTNKHALDGADPKIKRSIETMAERLHLDGPIKVAEEILASIDEEGLLQKQRMEDDSAAQAAGLAQEVSMAEEIGRAHV